MLDTVEEKNCDYKLFFLDKMYINPDPINVVICLRKNENKKQEIEEDP